MSDSNISEPNPSSTTTNLWQAIDTAPADQEILVFTKNWGPIIALHSTEYGEWMSRMQVPVGIKGEDELPTHWQHLPAPPPDVEVPVKDEPTGAAAAA
jgi:hypothetical protein